MVGLADSMVSSSARVLPMRVRPDLSAKQQRYLGVVYWVVKEPVGLHYFRFQEEEFAIMQMLDGQTSLDEIKIEFERRFPPQKITVEELGQFVGTLHRSGLVVASVAGQGEQLRKRGSEKWRKQVLGAAANFLCLRFRGFDPERFLNWLYPKVRWFYSGPARFVCAVMAIAALTLVMVQFETFQSKLPTFQQFFEAKNWIYLGVMLAVVKVLHEFGHGMTCKHFGGECHEMGIMFLVLTPCLYCNVSDSWMLPNKWHRAWIGAAGMYVELCIASVCTFIWWFSEPGMLNQLALNTMFVCSVSTVVFNANPLLRYDGYYILSDIMEIPNLATKARTILFRKMGEWCLGLEQPDDPFLPQRNQFFFAFYTVASVVYRWVIMFGIIWFMYRVLEPYGLKIISQTLATLSIASLIGAPIYQLIRFFSVPGKMSQVKRKNLNVTLGLVAALLAFVVLVPLPYRIICPLEVVLRKADPIHTVVPGILKDVYVRPGQHVDEKQELALLENIDLEVEVLELRSKRAETQTKLLVLKELAHQLHDEAAARELPEVQKALVTLDQQVEEREKDLSRLRLVASKDGYVLPAPDVMFKPQAEGQLAKWSGNPLDRRNIGATMQAAMFCQIGDPRMMDAMLVIDQDVVDFVLREQKVEIKLDQMPYHTFHTKVAEVGPEMAYTSKQLSSKGGGELMSKADESGREKPMNISFRACAELDDQEEQYHLIQGLRGTAKIHASWQPLGKRIWRYFTRTFNFKL